MNRTEGLLGTVGAALTRLGAAPGARLAGVEAAFLPLLLAHLSATGGRPVLASFHHDEELLRAGEALRGLGWTTDELVLFPAPAEADAPPGFDAPLEAFRRAALARLADPAPPAFILCTPHLLERGLPPASALRAAALRVQAGAVTFAALRAWLRENDYEDVPLVTEPGTYAVRGGIIDCFPVNLPVPVRFDFDGEVLEELRTFHIHSQTSDRRREAIVIFSCAETSQEPVPIYDYLSRGWVAAAEQPVPLGLAQPWPSPARGGRASLSPAEGPVLSPAEGPAAVWTLTASDGQHPGHDGDLQVEALEQPALEPALVAARWERLRVAAPHARALLVADETGLVDRARARFPTVPLELVAGDYPASFSSPALNLLVLAGRHLLARPAIVPPLAVAPAWQPYRQAAPSLATLQQHIDTLEAGDPIVHVSYGIGRYLGLLPLPAAGNQQEGLAIEYAGGDRVYVSPDKVGLVFPYTPEGDGPPPLDALNSRRWERVQQRTRRSAEEVVEQLAQLYARRQEAEGLVHAPDDELQQDMEATFPYVPTPDQLSAMDEIVRDMELPRPMDRLLCGDVGFGKTELALRAAFKAMRGGYQVALMAPTTILANQHFISFRARLEPFAVRVNMLSRFVPPATQRQTLQDLAAGSVDLLIGTHRLLSKEVVFKRLGLLIVDEEHRFGVKQKEHLKSLKASVDVLSMSATPIPRTLHFSLAGIRDISRLATPPLQRMPISTSVHYYGLGLLKGVIQRELRRDGQVYVVHSNVKDIHRLARDLQEALPQVKLAVAHGQQPARQLESTMLAFAERRFQLLVCTSIIESGIDLPNVNTVIINNAHRFGLAQLYQIRGRVGRGNRQAYAYLIIPRRPRLSRQATKRLKTIERHSALGSGYALALRDLEIRGTGNLFGLEQSGHVAAVGLDLYTRIIRDVVRERDMGGEQSTPLPRDDVTVRLFPDARLPAGYVADPHLRLNLYRRLASLATLEELDHFRLELADRFGPLPAEAEDLLRTARLAIRAAHLHIKAVRAAPRGRLHLDFPPPRDASELLSAIEAALEPTGSAYRFVNLKSGELRLVLTINQANAYAHAEDFLQSLEDKIAADGATAAA